MKEKCDDCKQDLMHAEIPSRGGYGPDLLPGTGILSHASFTIQVCVHCGRTYWWVKGNDLEMVKKSRKFSWARHKR